MLHALKTTCAPSYCKNIHNLFMKPLFKFLKVPHIYICFVAEGTLIILGSHYFIEPVGNMQTMI